MSGRRRYLGLTGILCAFAAAVAAAWVGGPIGADGPLLDLLVKARFMVFSADEVPEQAPVAVIAVDKRSLNEPELAPYPRAFLAPVWAAILDGVFEAGARAVGFDLLLAYSANQFSPNFDAPFLAALGTHREHVVLARSTTTLPARPFLAALRNDEGGLGLAELTADADGKYRRVRASHETLRDGAVPGLASALLQRAKGPSMPSEVVLAPRRHLEQIPTYAVVDVLRCAKYAPEALVPAFAGKIILVGSTLAEEDRRVSSGRFLPPQRSDAPPIHPCGLRRFGASNADVPSVPGVFLHAAAVEAVARGRMTVTAPTVVIVGLAAAMAALGAALGLLLAPWLAAAAIILLAGLLFGAATGLLAGDRWLPLALPLVALAAPPGLTYVVRYLMEERTRRRIENAFCHYLSPMIVERLASDASALTLGGERREVTVMFADLSGFTALSGQVDPEVLMRTTNQYLGYIVEQVEATGGYVDKFIGDAVMAVWGAPAVDPQHAVHGIRAAMAAVTRIHRAREAAKARDDLGFSVKIGLNSGPAVVGNVGTDKRYNYTAVGEMVNIAARLESVPVLYACQIVIGPRTAELAGAEFLLRELDAIQVKGRDAPLVVFEPLAEQAQATLDQRARAQRFAEALAHYRAMRFTEAAAIWEALAHVESALATVHDGTGEPPANPPSRMAERAWMLAIQPSMRPWDGVWVMTSK
jgi:adenylate cyclase